MTTPPPSYGGTGDNHRDHQQSYDSPQQDDGSQQPGPSAQQQGYGPSGYPPAPVYTGGPAPNEVDNSLGVIALITGLVGLLLFPPVAIAGIIYGRKSTASANAGRATNGSMGTAGLVLGIVGTVLLVIYVVLVVLGFLFFFGTAVTLETQ